MRGARVRLAAWFLEIAPPWMAEWRASAARAMAAAAAAAMRSGRPRALRAVHAAGELTWICPQCTCGAPGSRARAIAAHRAHDGRRCLGEGRPPASWRFIPWSAVMTAAERRRAAGARGPGRVYYRG